MTALAQAATGLALVMCFALLHTSRVATAAALLLVQSAAVGLAALVLHHAVTAAPPILLAVAVWLLRQRTPMLDPAIAPAGGSRRAIAAGAALTVLCQSQSGLAVAYAVVLLSILLAASRSHPLMQIIALVAMQNGLTLASSLITQPVWHPAASLPALLPPLACLVLPLPLAVGLLAPASLAVSGPAGPRLVAWSSAGKVWAAGSRRLITWVDLAAALGMFAATLIVPLDSLASVFGPLLGLDAVLRSCNRLRCPALSLARRSATLVQAACVIVAACLPNLIVAWLFLVAAAAMALFPTLTRRWGVCVLGFFAAGLVLFGALLLSAAPSVPAYFSLFAGLAMLAAAVPDLSVVAVILILRLANQSTWPPAVGALGIGIAVVALLACAALLCGPARRHRATLLQLAQASVAALAVCLEQPDGRFAALILLILLILTRAAARRGGEAAAMLALTGLGGVPPFGVFPGLVLVGLALSNEAPWLLLPIGIALIAMIPAALPRRLPEARPGFAIPSIAWLPLLLAALAGYVAPDRLIDWCRILTAGRP